MRYSLSLGTGAATAYLHILHLIPPHDLQQPFFFQEVLLSLSQECLFFQTFSSSKPNDRNLLKKPFHILYQVLIVSVFQIARF